MNAPGNEGSYRRVAVEGAGPAGLVIMLYDRLVADLRAAVSAMRRGDIEARCAELKHALLILQQLEGSLDHERGGAAAGNLAMFYSYTRAQVMEAQVKMSTALLEKLVAHVLDVKSAWQQVNQGHNQATASPNEYDSALPRQSEVGKTLLSCTV